MKPLNKKNNRINVGCRSDFDLNDKKTAKHVLCLYQMHIDSASKHLLVLNYRVRMLNTWRTFSTVSNLEWKHVIDFTSTMHYWTIILLCFSILRFMSTHCKQKFQRKQFIINCHIATVIFAVVKLWCWVTFGQNTLNSKHNPTFLNRKHTGSFEHALQYVRIKWKLRLTLI